MNTKRKLRAEAVENLKANSDWAWHDLADFFKASGLMDSPYNTPYRELRAALIDLLEDDELPEGDAVSILRRAADSDTPMVSLCDRFDAAPLLPSEHSRVFGQLADMVERDYVSREYLDEVCSEADYREGLLHESIDDLEAERDEWKAKAEQAMESYADAKDARDTWMANYLQAERAMNKAAGKWARADARSAERAAAVERLKNDARARFSPDAIVCALLDGRRGKIDWSLECDAILDLLTDDDGAARSNDGVTNLEWLYEHDRDALIAMAATHCDCEHCAYCETEKCVEDVRYGENDCYGGCREWLMAPHVDANDVFSGESVVTPEAVDANDRNATQDSREKLCTLDVYDPDGNLHSSTDIPKPTWVDDDGREWPEKPSKATPYEHHDSRENLGSEPSTLEDFGGKGSEVDSREKLEADVLKATKRTGTANQEDIWRWLDRQAAITERHWMEIVGASANANVELKRQIDVLTDQLESAHAKNRALKAHISKMQEGRHGWHIKAAKLQSQVDKLTAECGECVYKQEFASIDELQEKVDSITQANGDLRDEWHRVCRERDELQRKLHESNREREQLRKQLGIAIDHAHDMIALVSLDGDAE